MTGRECQWAPEYVGVCDRCGKDESLLCSVEPTEGDWSYCHGCWDRLFDGSDRRTY